MRIINAKVYTEDGVFKNMDVCTSGSLISEESSDDQIIDAKGCYLIPGLTDIHFHGCAGYDFCDGTQEAIHAMAQYEASQGITTIVPATMTLGKEELMRICHTAAAYADKLMGRQMVHTVGNSCITGQTEDIGGMKISNADESMGITENICNTDVPGRMDGYGAILAGINMEGPFISTARKGAQNAEFIHRPDAQMFRELNAASGNMVKLLAIAPEVEGAKECIRELKDEVVLSVAHTDADYKQAAEAFRNGVHHVTHLYNAMKGLAHREPGVVGAAADNENVEVELICDGIHIHPVTVRQTFKMFGDDRIIFISDSMEATGMPDGEYMLGGQKVKKTGRRATLADGTIAGSVTNLMDCVRVAVRDMGIPLESAVKCASVNPAKSVGIYDRYGSITVGKVANLVLLRESDLGVEKIILRGRNYI